MNSDYKTSWDLSLYYKDLNDPQIELDKEKVTELVKHFSGKYKGNLKNLEAQKFLEFFQEDDEIDFLVNKLAIFLHLNASLETQNQEILKKQAQFDNFVVGLSNQLLFVTQEFKDIGYEKLLTLSENSILKDYKNFFVRKAESIKYVLEEKTEFALNLKENSGVSAFNSLYEELTSSYIFEIEIDGQIRTLSEEEIRTLRMSPKEEVRKSAYAAIRKVYNTKQNQITLGNIYTAVVKDWTSEIKIRGYKSVLSQRNISEQIDDEAIELLLLEVENAYPLYQKYLKIKTKLLGKQKLMNWDLYAPVNSVEKQFSFAVGLETYLEVISKFDSEFFRYSKELLETGRVDVFPKPGKRSGAFCNYEKNFSSSVLLNYTGSARDVSTIAHELGHAAHGYFSQVQPNQVYHTGLCLAETASVFNETLLNNTLKEKLSQKDKLDFIEAELQDIFATIFRQVQYVLFEKEVHENILSGKELTYEDYNQIWRNQQLKMTGDLVDYDVSGNEETGWSGIPHIFHSPFYCYSYAFGNILSFALYQRYLNEGSSFNEKYKNILRSGGSKSPFELLKENGIDIHSAQFYRDGLEVVANLVSEFEALAK